jgi:hypothetical protein
MEFLKIKFIEKTVSSTNVTVKVLGLHNEVSIDYLRIAWDMKSHNCLRTSSLTGYCIKESKPLLWIFLIIPWQPRLFFQLL